jgi:hypothetical protein
MSGLQDHSRFIGEGLPISLGNNVKCSLQAESLTNPRAAMPRDAANEGHNRRSICVDYVLVVAANVRYILCKWCGE